MIGFRALELKHSERSPSAQTCDKDGSRPTYEDFTQGSPDRETRHGRSDQDGRRSLNSVRRIELIIETTALPYVTFT